MNGIYSLKIGKKRYIGKDSKIEKDNRYKQHMKLLKEGKHYNKHLQHAYNKYKDVEYEVLFKSEGLSDEEIFILEKEFIIKYDSFDNGYNMTLGGEGMTGYKFSKESSEKKSQKLHGERNGQSKISDEQFYLIVDLLKEGKSNAEIAKAFNISRGHVSSIRHKRRFKNLWKTVDDYFPIKSTDKNKKGKINEEVFIEIVNMIREGKSNAEISRIFSLPSGTVSRIRHKKMHKDFWRLLFNEDC